MSDTGDKATREARLARIRALMAKTVDNGCTEAEAASAASAVDKLLAIYEIDMTEVTVKEQPIEQLIVKIGDHVVKYATGNIALFTDCMRWSHNSRDIVYFGFKPDTEIAEYLTLVFKRAIDRETSAFTMFNAEYAEMNKAGKAGMLASFGMGMATRLGDRIMDLKSKRDFAQRTSGRDLVMMKKPMVQTAFELTGIVLGQARGRGTTIRNPGSYLAGRNAAEGVSLSQGIAGRAAAGGRIR